MKNDQSVQKEFLSFPAGRFGTILADPPWQFQNRTGKVAPEHKRLSRYGTMTLDQIKALPVASAAAEVCHLYLWVPNALLPDGLAVLKAWGFQYKTNLVWHKIRKDGGSDGRGVGFYFRNVTEMLLFGVRGILRVSGGFNQADQPAIIVVATQGFGEASMKLVPAKVHRFETILAVPYDMLPLKRERL